MKYAGIALLILMLAGCGQKGPLYRAEQPRAQKAQPTATPPAKANKDAGKDKDSKDGSQ